MKPVVAIIGAGPAGLTAALELIRDGRMTPIVFEASDQVGGISRTVEYKGNRMDIGGHRFFSKSDWVMNWWREILPIAAADDTVEIAYQGQSRTIATDGTAASERGLTMLVRRRLSRIYFLRKYFDYPIKLNGTTLAGKSALDRGFAGSFSELFLDYAGQRPTRLRPGCDCLAPLQPAASRLFDATSGWRLPPERFAELAEFIDKGHNAGHELRSHDGALAFVAEVRDVEARRQTLVALYRLGADSPGLPGLLKVALHPYQCEGALFAVRAGRALIEAWAPEVVIADEAQRIKNWNTIAARALKPIDSSYALALTSTPLENRIEEPISTADRLKDKRGPVGVRQLIAILFVSCCQHRSFETLPVPARKHVCSARQLRQRGRP